MAVSSTTATVYISRKDFSFSTLKNGSILSNSITFALKPRRFLIRSSSDVSAETTQPTETDSESSIEVPKGPPSLISTLNVERALRGIPITDIDYYGRLGIRRGCSYDQVTVAYKNKVEELLSRGLEEEELSKEMEILKESYSILSSNEDRRMYDWSLARTQKPDTYVWPFEVDTIKTSTETPPPVQEPENQWLFVGYFMLAWLILSVTLSTALNG